MSVIEECYRTNTKLALWMDLDMWSFSCRKVMVLNSILSFRKALIYALTEKSFWSVA
jgi:hypothetical protein